MIIGLYIQLKKLPTCILCYPTVSNMINTLKRSEYHEVLLTYVKKILPAYTGNEINISNMDKKSIF